MALLSANLILCESVEWENPPVGGGIPTAKRIMAAITVAPPSRVAHFFAITLLNSQPGDFLQHSLRIQITDRKSSVIAYAEPWIFQYGYLIDPYGPGGYILTTEFNIDLNPYPMPLGCLVSAFLDNENVARTPLILRRRG
jgi:hypothetical protein